MSGFYVRRRKRAWRKIRDRGMLATLVRGEPAETRQCYVLEDSFAPNQIDGSVIQRTDRRFLMASLDVTGTDPIEPPDEQHDHLVVSDPDDDSTTVELIMQSPPSRLAPGGIVIYYDLHCREK